MNRSFSTLIATAALVLAAGSAWAQSNPIPDERVPGFGGREIRPGSIGSTPGLSGGSVGSNVGAGATASPVMNEPTYSTEIAEAPPTRPLFGLSREIPATR